jgi:hypothetical protein
MFGKDGAQLLQRMSGTPKCRDRSDRRSALRPEQFPVETRGRDIVTQDGIVIAAAGDAAIGEESCGA